MERFSEGVFFLTPTTWMGTYRVWLATLELKKFFAPTVIVLQRRTLRSIAWYFAQCVCV